ncbi:MAG: hypothetical protein BGN82_05405 [Alphaproteobacteria bacterium 65-7]|nr:MAG: hypothetical protein BGN82_05405 [Alphaproteobacteria bacterium 65-7]
MTQVQPLYRDMALSIPDRFFSRLAPALPDAPAWVWRAGAGVLLLAGTGAVAVRHAGIGGGLLLAALLAEGLGQARARSAGLPAGVTFPLGLMLPPFGFALADPARALAAMFLTLALAVLTVLRRDDVSAVIWLAATALLVACLLPDHFSLLAYLTGIVCFIAAGQGVARRQT